MSEVNELTEATRTGDCWSWPGRALYFSWRGGIWVKPSNMIQKKAAFIWMKAANLSVRIAVYYLPIVGGLLIRKSRGPRVV